MDTTALTNLGFGGGQIIGQAADDAARIAALSQLQKQGEINAQPGEDQLRKAHARLYNANAAKEEKEAATGAAAALEMQRRFGPGGAARAGVTDGKVPLTAFPLAMADIYIAAGSPTKAMKSVDEASKIASQEAQQVAAAARAGRDRSLDRIRTLEFGAQLLTGVDSPEAAARAEAAYKAETGKSLFEGQPWTPELGQFMRERAMRVVDSENLKLRREAEERRAATERQQEVLRNSTVKLNEARTRQAILRADRIEKDVGKPPNAPNPNDINESGYILLQQPAVRLLLNPLAAFVDPRGESLERLRYMGLIIILPVASRSH